MKAVLAAGIDELRSADRQPGMIEVNRRADGSIGGLHFICPCGCGREGYLPASGHGHPSEWDFTGPDDRLTARPSVLQVGGCRWHGWLTEGEWVAC
ncbi:DUF6527 family protein [Thauera sp.]|uniref:DUF6527 family protein n=1 Tax=Thauera sp. TaxID=1905334 RepID=UPI002CBC29DC|nr:DUF6527 family protein [Thauera sp.]HRP26358.1 DUF6527 family protein [Thauera sp.]